MRDRPCRSRRSVELHSDACCRSPSSLQVTSRVTNAESEITRALFATNVCFDTASRRFACADKRDTACSEQKKLRSFAQIVLSRAPIGMSKKIFFAVDRCCTRGRHAVAGRRRVQRTVSRPHDVRVAEMIAMSSPKHCVTAVRMRCKPHNCWCCAAPFAALLYLSAPSVCFRKDVYASITEYAPLRVPAALRSLGAGSDGVCLRCRSHRVAQTC